MLDERLLLRRVARLAESARLPRPEPQLLAAVLDAERLDHHPDIVLSYRDVRLELSTHSDGGLTAQDFAFAAEINALPTDR